MIRAPSSSAPSGQATLEALALLPLLAAIVLAAFQLLAAGAARELAGNAAAAGAAAMLQGLDPEDAARDALPGWSRSRVSIDVSERRVVVRLRPVTVVPGVGGALTATAVASAGGATASGSQHPATDLRRTERMHPGASASREAP